MLEGERLVGWGGGLEGGPGGGEVLGNEGLVA